MVSSSLELRQGLRFSPTTSEDPSHGNGRWVRLERRSMPAQTLESRVERLERRVNRLEQLPERITALESQMVQLRSGGAR